MALPFPVSSPAGGGTWVGGRPANPPAELAGFELARQGQTGRGPESSIQNVRTREKDLSTTQFGAPARTPYGPDRRLSGSQPSLGRGHRGSAGGGAARDTWRGPRAASGRQEGG